VEATDDVVAIDGAGGQRHRAARLRVRRLILNPAIQENKLEIQE